MTLITAMKFNPHEGAIIADEESVNYNRKYMFSSKINQIEVNDILALFGGSGAADVLYDSNLEIRKHLEKNKEILTSNEAMANYIATLFNTTKRKYTNSYLMSKFGISEAEFHAGQKTLSDGKSVPIDRAIMDQYFKTVDDKNDCSNLTQNAYLILSRDNQGIELYIVSMNLAQATPIPRPYSAVGSGYDIADKELHDFCENIPREHRESIHPTDGLAALLYALERASAQNIGVGGTPHIKVVQNNKVLDPSENNSRLALEIVRATKYGLLPVEFQRESIDALIYKNVPFAEIDSEMYKATKDPKRLELFNRGYKV